MTLLNDNHLLESIFIMASYSIPSFQGLKDLRYYNFSKANLEIWDSKFGSIIFYKIMFMDYILEILLVNHSYVCFF